MNFEEFKEGLKELNLTDRFLDDMWKDPTRPEEFSIEKLKATIKARLKVTHPSVLPLLVKDKIT